MTVYVQVTVPVSQDRAKGQSWGRGWGSIFSLVFSNENQKMVVTGSSGNL